MRLSKWSRLQNAYIKITSVQIKKRIQKDISFALIIVRHDDSDPICCKWHPIDFTSHTFLIYKYSSRDYRTDGKIICGMILKRRRFDLIWFLKATYRRQLLNGLATRCSKWPTLSFLSFLMSQVMKTHEGRNPDKIKLKYWLSLFIMSNIWSIK